jgi:hypothetical protein
MGAPNLPRLRPGDRPTSRDYNAIVDAVAGLGMVGGTAFGDIGIAQGFGGVQLLDGREKGHWAKLTGSSGAAYSHVAVASNGDGTFTDLSSTNPNYEWGTTTSLPAWEVNGTTDIAADTIVWVWLDPVGNGWLFEFSGGAESVAADCRAKLSGLRNTECVTFTVRPFGDTTWGDAVEIAGAWETSGWAADSTIVTGDGDTLLTLFRRTEGGLGIRATGETQTWYGEAAGPCGEFAVPYCPPGVGDGYGVGSSSGPCDELTPCADHTFRVRVTCRDCAVVRDLEVSCKPGTYISRTLYATFSGALAELGTITLPYYEASPDPIMEFTFNGISPYQNGPDALSCYDSPGGNSKWDVILKLCSAGDDVFTIRAATELSRCIFANSSISGTPVILFDPFQATYTGTVGTLDSYGCLCDGASATVVITDTPPSSPPPPPPAGTCCTDTGEVFETVTSNVNASGGGLASFVLADFGGSEWYGNDTDVSYLWRFYCDAGTWKLETDGPGSLATATALTTDCATGVWTFDATTFGLTGTITVSV